MLKLKNKIIKDYELCLIYHNVIISVIHRHSYLKSRYKQNMKFIRPFFKPSPGSILFMSIKIKGNLHVFNV